MMLRTFIVPVLWLTLTPAVWAGQSAAKNPASGATVAGYQIVNVYPHDPKAFTQGLVYADGFLFESTGLYGRSSLRKVRLETGEIVQHYAVAASHFAEGLADWRGKLIQLTWSSGVGLVYDRATLRLERTFAYRGEGWGLTHDGSRLVLSDGSATLRFLHPDSFRETGRVVVRDRGVEVTGLNELEFVRGEVFANIWHSSRVARIAPASGEVLGWIDLGGLLSQGDVSDPEAVLNGIAYDSAGDRLFVTGKLWPKLFEIRLRNRAAVSRE